MEARTLMEGIHAVGAVDWDRRLFDSLIPLPDGTSYNAYVVEGTEKTALLDSVDPTMTRVLMGNLEAFPRIDYVVSHHAEQDHSGAIPRVLEKYPRAKVVATPKGKTMLMDHLGVPGERLITVEDGESLSLGGRTLLFIHTPWVHWPETMCTWLKEDGVLFSCDFFGAHLAQSGLWVEDDSRTLEAAKRYWAEIMMPFRGPIRNNLEKIGGLQPRTIAPSHGPVHRRPALILDAYAGWALDDPGNEAVIAYVSMHGSTRAMVERLAAALAAKGVTVSQFHLPDTDLGKLAISLVDAATIIVGTPTVLFGPHPAAVYALCLANALRPRLRFVSVIGSYGWGSKVVEQVASLIPQLKVELIDPVICKGYPREADLAALDALAGKIAARHAAGREKF